MDDIENKIEAMKKKLEALKAKFLEKLEDLQNEVEMQREQEEPKPWKPEVEEKYFYIGNTLETGKYFNEGYPVDDKLITAGNCFPTRERAEQVAKKMRLLLQLEQLHDMICPDYKPDWENEKDKFCLCYLHEEKRWSVESWLFFENQGFVWFDTFENAEKAAEILNKEMGESE